METKVEPLTVIARDAVGAMARTQARELDRVTLATARALISTGSSTKIAEKYRGWAILRTTSTLLALPL